MRILDQHSMDYTVHEYPHGKEAVDGLTVANLLNQDVNTVFKTLVTISNTKEYFVFMLPVDKELNLKKCAKVSNMKSVEMIPVKDIMKVTGYVRGGCSPLAMKKQYKTFIHESILDENTILFSAGKIGMQIEMNPIKLIELLDITVDDLVK